MAAADDFPARGQARAFHREAKSPALAIEALARRGLPARPSRGLIRRREGRKGAASPTKETTPMPRDPDHHHEPHASSPTAQVLTGLQLYGYHPRPDEPDPRPLPDEADLTGAVTEIFDALAGTLGDSRLEPELDDLLWSAVQLFHRATGRIERELDRNEQTQRRTQAEQDGSEVQSVILERLLVDAQNLIERRDAFETMRDEAAAHYERHIGTPWRPRAGSMVNHKSLTATLIDSHDFLMARKRAEQEVLLPSGPKIAFTGGLDCNDHRLIWDALDRVHAKYRDMVLLHGKSPKGAERIAACWADHRKVPQIGFAPDWTRHGRAAPFRRNDTMLEILPMGVMIFPGTGIQDNLADKAKKLGIPVWRFSGA